MSYTVQQIINGLGKPVTANPNEPVQNALNRMLANDYSQLPVVKEVGQSTQFYLITSDSILQALGSFGLTTNDPKLLVGDALKRISPPFRVDDDVFDLMKGIAIDGAALVMDDQRQLIHIVTSYDTTTYFRQWAEDIMYARDVEDSLKKYITAAFKMSDGTLNDEARQRAINEIASSNKTLRYKFAKALNRYLEHQSKFTVTLNPQWAGKALSYLNNSASGQAVEEVGDGNTEGIPQVNAGEFLKQRFEGALSTYIQLQVAAVRTVNARWSDDAFGELLDADERPRSFRDLTLDNIITLFFGNECWPRCCEALRFDEKPVRDMLGGVRETRNKLAHFREEEITTQNRIQLKQCADWLSAHAKQALSAFEASASPPPTTPQSLSSNMANVEVRPVVEPDIDSQVPQPHLDEPPPTQEALGLAKTQNPPSAPLSTG